MTTKFKLGPNQKRWLKMLETTKLKQSQGTLFDGRGYCCLGIAQRSRGKKPGELKGSGYLDSEATEALQLHSYSGAARRGLHLNTCAGLNDDLGWSFRKIARHLRKHARAYFRRAA